MVKLADSKISAEAPELLIAQIKKRHRLTSVHIFDRDGGWRVFGFRGDAGSFEASVEEGSGPNIAEALEDLNMRLIEGPIHADRVTDKVEAVDGWHDLKSEAAPHDIPLDTKIHDQHGVRNEAQLVHKGQLWFLPDLSMYVYYKPTHWKLPAAAKRMGIGPEK